MTFPEEAHFDNTNSTTFKNWVLIAARAQCACRYLEGTIVKPNNSPDTKIEKKPTE